MNKIYLLVIICLVSKGFSTKFNNKESSFFVYSSNHFFQILINPPSNNVSVKAKHSDLDSTLFQISHKHYFDEYFLSNDGECLVIVSWKFVQIDLNVKNRIKYIGTSPIEENDTAILFYNKKGLINAYTYDQICLNPTDSKEVEPHPIGDFWRVWNKNVSVKNGLLYVESADNKNYYFSLCTGKLVIGKLIE